MSKKLITFTLIFGIVALVPTIFPKMLDHGVARTLQYVHIVFSFILFGIIFYILSRLEFEKAEKNKLLQIFEAKKRDIYKLRQALNESSLTLKSILAEEGQGYLTLGPEGRVSLNYSRSCVGLLECDPHNLLFAEVLKVPEEEVSDFNLWFNMLFEEPISFEEAAPLGPSEYFHSQGLKISLTYSPIRNEVGEVLKVLVSVQDKTDLEEMSKKALEKSEESEVIARLIKQKESFIFFNQEFNEGIKNFKMRLIEDRVDNNLIKEFLRYLHGVKGGFLQIGVNSLAIKIHDREDAWAQLLINDQIEVLKEQLELDLKFLKEEWVKFVGKYSRIVGYSLEETQRIIEFKLSEAVEMYINLSIVSIPEKINERFKNKIIRPIGDYFEQYQDLVLEIAKSLKKNIYPLEIEGGDIKIMPEAYKEVFVSMGHIFRNSIDHGIEKRDRRLELNKDPKGKIRIKISTAKENKEKLLLIEVFDDGKGIDTDILREKLIKNGDSKVATLDDFHVLQRIFDDGISTKSEKLDLLSGRGVGVSAVKSAVEAMNGKIWVESEVNMGSHFYIKIPFVEITFKNIARNLG